MQLHTAHTNYCSDVNETRYIQGCDGIHHIIPVTLFLVLLYNVCLRFQHDKTTNLLISALDCFDLGTSGDNDTFMTTISNSTNSTLISKQEFHAIINNFAYTTARLTWYVHGAANITSTKIAKKTSVEQIVGKCSSSSKSFTLVFVINRRNCDELPVFII